MATIGTIAKVASPRELPSYQEGRKAFMDGMCEDDCPYKTKVSDECSCNRTAWFTGYFDCRTGSRFAELFRRRGITWP